MIIKMKKSYFLPFLAAGLMLTGCSKENPFDPTDGEGEFLKSALSMDVQAQALNKTRAEVDVDINEFNVVFTREGHSEPEVTYKYGEMPEVVTLPEGSYIVTATYGENRQAEWESPYFLGKSESFDVTRYEITSYIDPIVCRLENVMVTIDYDAELRAAMSADSYVEVKVGNSGSLNYGIAEADAKKAGYFRHSDEISLVAVFHGTVDGAETVETKSLKDIQKGCHYNVTFRLHNGGPGSGTGDISGDVTVDADVTVVDVERDVEIGDEPLLDDNERPTESDEPGPGPEDPEDPKGEAPTILLNGGELLDTPYDGTSMSSCVVSMTSTAEGGFTTFICNIHSEALEPALPDMGIPSHIDLANPEAMTLPEGATLESLMEQLKDFGFPLDVKGKKSTELDLTQFLQAMAMLGPGQHAFELIVGDANGETTRTLTLNF